MKKKVLLKEQRFTVIFDFYHDGSLGVKYNKLRPDLMLLLAADLLYNCTDIANDDNVMLDLFNIIKARRGQKKNQPIKI